MAIEVGMTIPGASLLKKGADGFETIEVRDYLKGKRVVMFGLPGAFTTDCSNLHLPSFVRTADAFRAKGFDEIICVAVNDPFVMNAWGDSVGAAEAGITMLADADAGLTKALGMNFSAPPIGFYDRSGRYAVAIENGVVTHASIDAPSECTLSRGEEFLATLD